MIAVCRYFESKYLENVAFSFEAPSLEEAIAEFNAQEQNRDEYGNFMFRGQLFDEHDIHFTLYTSEDYINSMKLTTSNCYYRVANSETQQGLWYDWKGDFTGLIHDKFDFCKNKDMSMDYDPELVGWLSATKSLDQLHQWFPIEDIINLQQYGWRVHVYKPVDNQIRFYEKFQHEVIAQSASELIGYIEYPSLNFKSV